MPRRWVAALAALVLPVGLIVAAPTVAHAGDVSTKVVNGRPPVAGEFGFLAAVQATARTGDIYVCGGSFVSATQIVTAAHCFHDPDGRRMTTVFIVVDHERLVDRMRSRAQDHEDEIAGRMRTAERELLEAHKFDFIIESRTRDEDFAALLAILEQARARAAAG